MPGDARPLTVGPREGTTIQGPVGGLLTFKVRGEQTNGTLTVFENTVTPPAQEEASVNTRIAQV